MGRTAEEPRPRDGRLGEPTRMAACISRDQIGKAPLESAHHSPVGRMTGDSDSPAAPPIIAHGLAESGMGVLHGGRIGPNPT
jgi:hypothetical protein